MSDPAQGFPAWIELRWPQPISPRRIQLIFDTGMHRHLTMTHSDAYAAKMIWGQPQPETVRDYRVEGLVGGQWQTLVEVTGNYQRRRVHDLTGTVSAVRVVVTGTNGIDHARICEISLS